MADTQIDIDNLKSDGYSSESSEEPPREEPFRAFSAGTERDISERNKKDLSGPKPKKVPKGKTAGRKHAMVPPPKGK